MKIDIHIIGVCARQENINKTLKALNLSEDIVSYDDRPNGGACLYNAKKVYRRPVPEGVTHRVIIADDVQVCNNFIDICTQIVETHPDKLIGLFPFFNMKKSDYADNLKTPYVEAMLAAGMGMIIPVEHLDKCTAWIEHHLPEDYPEDLAVSMWCSIHKVPIINTIPAVIQHIGDDSILTPGAPIRRTVYFSEDPVADWTCKEVAPPEPKPETLFANRRRRI
jgi:hypothetical protein